LCANVDLSAHQRLNSVDGQIILMVRGELDAARGQFPGSTHMLAALMEEVGELAQALMEHDRDGSQTTQEVLREAVQVAAMAIRVAAEGDENFVYEFPTVEADLPRGPVGGRYD
jgi:NTP pyrophosphatase (non-canonical NTP hydrolase)